MSTSMNFTRLGVNQIKTEPLDPEYDGEALSAWDFPYTPTDLPIRVKEEFLPARDITNELVRHPPSRPNFSVKRENNRWDCNEGSSLDSESSSSSGENRTDDENIEGTSIQYHEQPTNIHNPSALNLRDFSVKLVDILPKNVRKLRNVSSSNKSCSSASFEVSCRSSALTFKEVSVKLIDIFPDKIPKMGKVQSACRSRNTPPEQSKLFQCTDALKLRDVSVKLVNIFPNGVRKLGTAYSNNKACTRQNSQGDKKYMSAFRNHPDNHVNNSRPAVSQLSIKSQKTPRKSIKRKMQEDQVSPELEEHFQKFAEGATKKNHQKVKFVGVSPGTPPSAVRFKRNGTNVPFSLNCVEGHRNQTFICKVCSMNCKSNAGLKIHSVVHTGERPFCCAFCPKRYTQKSAVMRHMRSKHLHRSSPKRTEYNCNFCSTKFLVQKHFMQHMTSVHQKSAVNCHVSRKHSKIKSHRKIEYSCNYCSAKFLLQKHFAQHTVLVHQDKQPFRCKLCPTKFTQAGHLNHHVKMLHRKQYRCNLCPSNFFTLCELNGHLKVVHHTDKPNLCNLCSASFRSKDDLSDHIKSKHLKVKAYNCHLCSKKFGWNRSLTVHIKCVHGRVEKKFAGNLCSSKDSGLRGLKNKSNLSNHMKAVHLKEKAFNCNQCSKKFRKRSTLREHVINIHSIVKKSPNRCGICSAKFARTGYLREHTRSVHLKEMAYNCNLCPKKFIWRNGLYLHKRKAHSRVKKTP